jgi:hypothetical protein
MLFEFLDTPGDEVAPGSNEIGKDFKNQWLRHCSLLFVVVPTSSNHSNDQTAGAQSMLLLYVRPTPEVKRFCGLVKSILTFLGNHLTTKSSIVTIVAK